MKRSFFFAVIFFFQAVVAQAATYTATATGGEWTDPATWVGGVVPPTNGTGDVVVIPAGSVVTITNQIVYFNGTVEIYGTLSLLATTTGFFPIIWAELNMDATSIVNVYSSGLITSGGGGFWEDLNGIVIGDNLLAYWPAVGAGSNPQTGPVSFNSSTNGPLPVELLFFNARVRGEAVELTWATASEENFDYFALERSVNGQDFYEIARISGVGNSDSRVDYDYTDEMPMQGISYYRLRSVDFDGYTEVFDYVMVEVEGQENRFLVYPNPVTDGTFSLQTNFETDEDARLLIYDSMGNLKKQIPVTDWQRQYEVHDLETGTYLFRLVSSEGVMVQRILVY